MSESSNRREFLTESTLAFAAAALSGAGIVNLISAEAQAGESKKKEAGGEKLKSFAKAVAHCKETGELCLAHCARELAAGNTEMAKCHGSVQSMLAICDAALKLVAAGSAQARKAVELCAAVCKECAESCEEHKAHFGHGMHLECKDCGEACRDMEKACKAWLA